MDTMTRSALPAARLPGRGHGGARSSARRLVLGIVNLLVVWQRRLEDRACLQAMNEVRLRDIGLTRVEARRESDKPFWRA